MPKVSRGELIDGSGSGYGDGYGDGNAWGNGYFHVVQGYGYSLGYHGGPGRHGIFVADDFPTFKVLDEAESK